MERLTFDGEFCDISMCREELGGPFCEEGYCSQRRVALNDAFGFGPERCKKFVDALNAAVNETADMVDADTRDMEYSIAKFEERLKQVVGPYYMPRNERYG